MKSFILTWVGLFGWIAALTAIAHDHIHDRTLAVCFIVGGALIYVLMHLVIILDRRISKLEKQNS